MRLQVTDLFFRPLFAFFNTLVAVAKGHPCACDARSDRSLGSAYRYERRLRLDNDQQSCFERMTAHSGSVLHGWQQPVASKCFERRTEFHERMPSANAFS